MDKIKNIIIVLLIVLMFGVFTNVNAQGKKKVKVYVFEAVGCPACNSQKEYLANLSKTNDKFEVVVKELYKDTSSWQPSKDYELGVKVVNVFQENGFKEAKYTATPLVVVGTSYAKASLNTDMEKVINKAYEEQQADVVECIEKGSANCSSLIKESDELKEAKKTDMTTKLFLMVVVLAMAGYYLAKKYKEKQSK